MAKIQYGAIVTSISGGIQGHIFARNRSGAYIKKNSIPTNPQSVAQSVIRNAFAGVASAWRDQTQAVRDAWIAAAGSPEWNFTDRFGNALKLSGQQLFMKLNQQLLVTGYALDVSTPTPGVMPLLSAFVLTATVTGPALSLAFDGDGTDYRLLVYATPQLNASISASSTPTRFILSSSDPLTSVNLLASYQAQFPGALTQGKRISLRLAIMSEIGQVWKIGQVTAVVGA